MKELSPNQQLGSGLRRLVRAFAGHDVKGINARLDQFAELGEASQMAEWVATSIAVYVEQNCPSFAMLTKEQIEILSYDLVSKAEIIIAANQPTNQPEKKRL